VMGGVARRAWARNENALETAKQYNKDNSGTDCITIPYLADNDLIKRTLKEKLD